MDTYISDIILYKNQLDTYNRILRRLEVRYEEYLLKEKK